MSSGKESQARPGSGRLASSSVRVFGSTKFGTEKTEGQIRVIQQIIDNKTNKKKSTDKRNSKKKPAVMFGQNL